MTLAPNLSPWLAMELINRIGGTVQVNDWFYNLNDDDSPVAWHVSNDELFVYASGQFGDPINQETYWVDEAGN